MLEMATALTTTGHYTHTHSTPFSVYRSNCTHLHGLQVIIGDHSRAKIIPENGVTLVEKSSQMGVDGDKSIVLAQFIGTTNCYFLLWMRYD